MAEIWGGWPRQILRTSCEEGPLPGAAHSWTWEGKAASPGRPSPTPHGVEAGEGEPSVLTGDMGSFQLCGLPCAHVCAHVRAHTRSLRCTHLCA